MEAPCASSVWLLFVVIAGFIGIHNPADAMGAAPLVVFGQTEGKSLWGLLEQGGWAMYPLALCCLALFFLIIYGWRETSKRGLA